MDIRVELDSPRVHCGQSVSGRVHLRGDCSKADKLVIRVGWEATRHGAFNEVSSGVLATSFSPGDDRATFPFRVLVPDDAPVSYSGREVSLTWHCEAYLDVPWAFDPIHKVPFKVEPRPQFEKAVRVPAEVTRKGLGDSLAANLGTALMVLLFCMFIPHMIFLAIVLGPFLLAWWLMRLSRVSSFTFNVNPKEKVMFGQPIHYVLTFRTRTGFDINCVSITLSGKEHWTTGSGKSRQSHSVEFLKLEETPARACRLPSGQFKTEGEFVIDNANLPTSVSSTFDYTITATIDIPWWPDVDAHETITVIPVEAGAEPHEHDERGREITEVTGDDASGRDESASDDAEFVSVEDDGADDEDGDDESAGVVCRACGQTVRDVTFCPGCGVRLRE